MKIKLLKSISILGSFLALSVTIQAQTTIWTGAVNDDWNNAGNWNNGVPNGSTLYQSVVINGTARITSSTPRSSYERVSLQIGDAYSPAGTLIIDGVSFSTSYSASIHVGYSTSSPISGYFELINSDWTATYNSNLSMNAGSATIRNSQLKMSGLSMARSTTNLIVDTSNISFTNSYGSTLYGKISFLNSGKISFAGDVRFESSSNLEFYLSSQETKLSVGSGSITLSGGTLSLFEGYEAFVGGESFDILDFRNISGTFGTISTSTLAEGLSWNLSQLYTSGVVSIDGSIIPEPSTYAAIFGILALGFAIYRKRK